MKLNFARAAAQRTVIRKQFSSKEDKITTTQNYTGSLQKHLHAHTHKDFMHAHTHKDFMHAHTHKDFKLRMNSTRSIQDARGVLSGEVTAEL